MFKSYIITLILIVAIALLVVVPVVITRATENLEVKIWVIIVLEIVIAAVCITIVACIYNNWKKRRDLWEQDINQLVQEWNQRHGCLENISNYKDEEYRDNFGVYLEAFENGKQLKVFKLGPEGVEFVNSIGGLNSDTMRLITSRRSHRSATGSTNPQNSLRNSSLKSSGGFWIESNSDRMGLAGTKSDKNNKASEANTNGYTIRNVIQTDRSPKNNSRSKNEIKKTNQETAPNTSHKLQKTRDPAVVMEEKSQLSIDLDDMNSKKRSKYKLPAKEDVSDLDIPNNKLTKSDLMFLQEFNDQSLNQVGNKSSFIVFDEKDENKKQFDPYQELKRKNSALGSTDSDNRIKTKNQQNHLFNNIFSTIKKPTKTYIGDENQLKINFNSGSTKHSSLNNQQMPDVKRPEQPLETPRLGGGDSYANNQPDSRREDQLVLLYPAKAVKKSNGKSEILRGFEKYPVIKRESPMRSLHGAGEEEDDGRGVNQEGRVNAKRIDLKFELFDRKFCLSSNPPSMINENSFTDLNDTRIKNTHLLDPKNQNDNSEANVIENGMISSRTFGK